jgi:DNA-binding transcriptional ArsR family regulator
VSTLPHHDALDMLAILPEHVPVSMPELPAKLVISTDQQFKAISDPFRSRILGIIQHQPATAKQIAARIGATPGAIGHHLHVLEAAGLAQVVARRLVRGTVAKYYTRTARIFVNELSQDVAGTTELGLAILAQAHEELAEVVGQGENDPYRTESFPHVRLSPERAQLYRERLLAIVSDLLEEVPDPAGHVYGFLISMFKSPSYLQVEPSSEERETNGGIS